MTEQELSEIEARANAALDSDSWAVRSAADVPALVAEVRELSAMVEINHGFSREHRMRAEKAEAEVRRLNNIQAQNIDSIGESMELTYQARLALAKSQARVAELEAEVRRLKALVADYSVSNGLIAAQRDELRGAAEEYKARVAELGTALIRALDGWESAAPFPLLINDLPRINELRALATKGGPK